MNPSHKSLVLVAVQIWERGGGGGCIAWWVNGYGT